MPLVRTSVGEIHYAQRGVEGPAIVLIHGAGGSHTSWGHQLRDLAAVGRVYAPDLPGHGRSPLPGRAAIHGYVTAVLGLLDALGLERAVLIGHSMGGAICLQAAVDAPERVLALGVVGAAARMRVAPALINGFDEDVPATIRTIVQWSYAADTPIELIVRAEADYSACDPQVFKGDLLACDRFDVTEQIARITSPATVIVGSEDRMLAPARAEQLQRGLRDATLVIVPGAGHTTMVEQPQAVSRALGALLARVTE